MRCLPGCCDVFPSVKEQGGELMCGMAICHHFQKALKGTVCLLALPTGPVVLLRASLAALLFSGLEDL